MRVNGIGREAITQLEFYQAYADLFGIKLRPIFIKPENLKGLAREFPKGHFSEYAVEGLSRLMAEEQLFSPEEIEKLLGRSTKRMSDLYGEVKGQAIEAARPPVGSHMKTIVQKILKCRNARQVFFTGAKEILPMVFPQLVSKKN